MAVLSARENLPLKTRPVSDTASIFPLVLKVAKYASEIKFMRDPTRGGLSAVLNEIVGEQKFGMHINEASLPFSPTAKALSELLGIDLTQVASEGRLIMICSKAVAPKILDIWHSMDAGKAAAIIGEVTEMSVTGMSERSGMSGRSGKVTLETLGGGKRFLDLPPGELLPRIC